ncbi:DUF948 domain-containing protein [Aerococcaceae bacterium DSM 111021]|nr:DUF948 domain-containing protein [Aerococcaceae bacterium DSM 111021]
MTLGELAGIIAALAFVVLVIFICLNLSKLSQILKDVNETVTKLNTTIDVVTKDVDNLSIEVEGLLNKANTLVDDVNGKLSKTDPLFVAIGDLGTSVSDLNDSTKNMTSNLLKGVGKKRQSPIEKFVSSAKGVARKRPTTAEPAPSPRTEAYNQPVTKTTPSVPPIAQVERDSNESELFEIKNKLASKTAGEITIKN